MDERWRASSAQRNGSLNLNADHACLPDSAQREARQSCRWRRPASLSPIAARNALPTASYRLARAPGRSTCIGSLFLSLVRLFSLHPSHRLLSKLNRCDSDPLQLETRRNRPCQLEQCASLLQHCLALSPQNLSGSSVVQLQANSSLLMMMRRLLLAT